MVKRKGSVLLVLLVLLLTTAAWIPTVAATDRTTLAVPDGVLVIDRPHSQLGPRTDGINVVWEDAWDEVRAHWDIVGADTTNGWVFPVDVGGNTKHGPDIDGDIVVWSDSGSIYLGGREDSDIRGMNIATGEEFVVADTPDYEVSPAISGDWVVWFADDDSYYISKTLFARNIRTMDAPIVIAEDVGFRAISPAIDDGRVVWVDPDDLLTDRLYARTLGDNSEPVLLRESISIGDISLDIGGETVVYMANRDVVAQDIVTGAIRTLAEATEASDMGNEYQRPTTDGRYACWTNNATWFAGGNWIECYDLATDSRWRAFSGGYSWIPHVENGTLVWAHWDEVVNDQASDEDIYIARIADLTPAAARPQPDLTIPEVDYYPETGHSLGWQFRMYWEGNGGLPVFGYPLTEEYEERSQDTGQFQTVQFFERQRFERHPEYAGTPYEVLLGRLGYEDALARELLVDEPFQPILRDIVRGDCVWFGEARQMACTDFISYWRTHGLDLGDDGTSYRESLALFGYPISQPYIDSATGLLTQYFERAVFELHPHNPDPYRVLLRRLGAEVLEARGW